MAKLALKKHSHQAARVAAPDCAAPGEFDREGPATGEDGAPGKEELAAACAALRAYMRMPSHAEARGRLRRLALLPPQVLLLEGGTAQERLAAAHYWSLLLNCQSRPEPEQGPGAGAEPCLACSACIRMLTHQHRDCFFFDGLAGSIKIDEVRAMRGVLGEAPREARRRVVIFWEAQALVEAAANALLKSFEEPRPQTSFLLLVAQRERLLPTLASRSFCLTLPWPREQDAEEGARLAPWESALCAFLATGRGFFERSGVKGAVDASLVHCFANRCRRALVHRLGGAGARADAMGAGQRPEEEKRLETLLALLPDARVRMLDEALAECQDSLIFGVNPALVLEWLVTRMYFLIPRR